MDYKVYNERNILVTVTDEQLEKALAENGKDFSIEILGAMSVARKVRFASRLREALYHENQRARIEAIYGLLSLSDTINSAILQEKEQSLPEDDIKAPISEKAILRAVLIRLEKGPEGVCMAFFDENVYPLVKTLLLRNYSSSSLPLTKQDVEFLVKSLEAYVEKSAPWIKKIKKDEYEEDIISCLEGLMRASEEQVLKQLQSDLQDRLVKAGSQILKMKIDPYAKEIIAIFARGLPSKIAYTMLAPIMGGHARGDIRKELEQTIRLLHLQEQH